MKKIVYEAIGIISLIVLVLPAKAQEAFYIYRNDGEFNAFFCDEVDSITYSNYDIDSVYHENVVVQDVYTQDSICRIPLAAIDSVSFCKPENRYSSRVRKIDNLIQYITDVDGMTICLSSSTPSNLFPKKGDVLLYEYFEDERLPLGFAGKVAIVDNQRIVCDSVSFEEVYDKYVCFGEYIAIGDQDNNGFSRLKLAPRKVEGNISPSISIKETIGSQSSGLSATLDGRIAFNLRIICKVDSSEPPYFDLSISPNIKATIGVGVKGKFDPVDFLSSKVTLAGIPIPNTLFFIKVKGGPVIKPSIEASVTASTEAELGFRVGIRYKQGQIEKYFNNKSKGFTPPTIKGSISGRLFAGIQLEFGIFSVGEILSASVEKELGPEFVANLTENMLKTNKYEELQDAKVDLNFLASVDGRVGFKFSAWGVNANLTGKITLGSINVNIFSWKLVPSFSVPIIESNKSTTILSSVIPSDKLIRALPIGLGIWNKNGDLIDAQYCPEKYRITNEWPFQKYMTAFTNLLPNTEYTICPLVDFFGMELKASPATDFKTDAAPVIITNFKVTKSQYFKAAFINKGRNYDFSYGAEVTVTFDGDDNVEDWGYVYEDLNGDTAHVSLKTLGSPYTDTRYSYYRNEPQSYATLYGYVKYFDDENYYHGEKTDYPLVYDKKPIAITLEPTFIDTKTAKIKCSYKEAAPWKGTCGVEYWYGQTDRKGIKTYFETADDEVEISLNNLLPNTTYYYQAFIKVGEEYAEEFGGENVWAVDEDGIRSFTTLPVVTFQTGDAKEIKETSAILTGTATGFDWTDERVKLTFDYSTEPDLIHNANGKTVIASYDENYGVSASLSGLSDYTTYYYTLGVKCGDHDISYGEEFHFRTNPKVTTHENPTATYNSATLQGSCSKGVTIAGFSVKKDGDVEYTQYNAYPDENGNFSVTVEDLDIETKYVYYAFVQTEEKTYNGEKYSFETKPLCPDGNHPHMIDLGLPSGTKWACCNVGANAPEDEGNYYAWGEAVEKEEYDINTYQYKDNNENCLFIGEDISGSQYDTARLKWGNPWLMPSRDHFNELVENCELSWITYKGKQGVLFSSSNGQQIILLPNGIRDCCMVDSPSQGFYWTSDFSQEPPVEEEYQQTIYAYCFIISGNKSWGAAHINGHNSRVYGMSIRPIVK